MQILLQWEKQKVQTNMQKLPVLEIQLFIQFNKNQIYYVILDELAIHLYEFSDHTIVSRHFRISELEGMNKTR